MDQPALFHDTWYDAMSADVAACGGIKTVSGQLWPALDSVSAAAKLRACLNINQAQNLDQDEVMKLKQLAREFGSDATVRYESQQLGLRYEWIAAKDQAEELRREIRDSLQSINRRMERLERVELRVKTV